MRLLTCPFNLFAKDGLPIDRGDETIQDQLLTGQSCMGRDGHLAAPLQALQEGPFCGHSRMGCLMIESG
jgi:hypothetical protein